MRTLSCSLILFYSLSTFTLSAVEAPKVVSHPVSAVQDTETKEQRDERMAWWRAARFGMFIHWGVYSVPGGVWEDKQIGGGGEWIMCLAKIPIAKYLPLTAQFNPTKFDADAWVSTAKAAGMKYIVITAKHHDGFAMFKSEASPFNIVDATPFKRDPLQELAAACKKQDIKLGFYYSQDQDWTTPGAGALREHWDPAQEGDFAQYQKTKVIPQIKELLSNYGDAPAVLWFDTPTKKMTPEMAAPIVEILNQHPHLIWNNRLGGGYKGDTKTPEQNIPPHGYPGEDWETCMTINGTWGYKSFDDKFKTTDTLLRNLIDIASKGGNYLLNVGPDSTGTIPQPEVDRLKEMGHWLDVNGEAIYGCGPTAFGDEDGTFDPIKKDPKKGTPLFHATWDWRCTTKPGKLFIHLLKWPGTSFTLNQVKAKVTTAYLLADPQHKALNYSQEGTAVKVTLPETALDPIATVLVLETK